MDPVMDESLSVNVDRSLPVNDGDGGECETLVLAHIFLWLPADEQETCWQSTGPEPDASMARLLGASGRRRPFPAAETFCSEYSLRSYFQNELVNW